MQVNTVIVSASGHYYKDMKAETSACRRPGEMVHNKRTRRLTSEGENRRKNKRRRTMKAKKMIGATCANKKGNKSTKANINVKLFKAVKGGKLNEVKDLIGKGANVNAKGMDGTTPLIVAAGMGKLDVVKILAGSGANVNAKDDVGTTPLMEAIKINQLAMVKFLVAKGADVNAFDNEGRTPLIMASNKDVVTLLKKSGAEQ